MAINADEVRKIAHLARLEIRDEDIVSYARNLSNILGLVEQLAQADTTHVLPMAHALGDKEHGQQRLRDDTVSEKNQRDYFQQQAPAVRKGLYLVPKVIE